MTMLWDISPAVHPGSPVFPGDTPFRQHWDSTIGPASAVNLSTLTFSPHIGAHADAPLHYDPQGAAIGTLALEPYLGLCRVIHAIDCGPLVEWEHLAPAVHGAVPARVLVRTRHQAAVDHWDSRFSAFAPATLEYLADLGVRLVGIDTPSVDPADSPHLPCHQVLRQRQMRVLENLVLDEVPEGDYELIALPLKLTTADASPVRAVLRSLA
ncbi:MAG: arylformamidase [Burkholderiales bacterium RIFCSPLOWO2_12_FULL_65_40]|nr:MAG: arylformamidase [Burkholderiales bacterium RIFCSPLOWO2_12_FULL_65_40]